MQNVRIHFGVSDDMPDDTSTNLIDEKDTDTMSDVATQSDFVSSSSCKVRRLSSSVEEWMQGTWFVWRKRY